MSVVRFLLATLCAGFLTGCAAHIPILEERGDAAASQDAQIVHAATPTPPVTQNMKVVHAPDDGDGLIVIAPADGEPAAATQEKKRKARAGKPAAINPSVVSSDVKQPVQGSATRSGKASAPESAPESIANYRERAKRKAEEDERRERNLKKEINGICSGC
jgi:hypothetical protein